MITCRNCLEALHPFLDRELSEEDVLLVHAHLNACHGCEHLFRFEESLRRLVRVRCQETRAPEALRERIAERLALEAQRLQKAARRPAKQTG